ncbi:MAG: phosphoribosylglycinamide formyltransferase [Bacteroidetes bacterium]|nr:phosphoribosylglycinamide formyltransferase [Bacteroidota bacterium]
MFNCHNVSIFVSGTGSNAKNLIRFFSLAKDQKIKLILSEKENPELESLCNSEKIHFLKVDKQQSTDVDFLVEKCNKYEIHYIILAGFLKKIPEKLIQKYPEQIINIHPSLLPKFGGKGMFGDNVHKAVLESKEKESGITIHLVNEEYDKGKILGQFTISIDKNETVKTLKEKIQKLEHTHFPPVIYDLLQSTKKHE